jgi:hypothetical protein
MLILFSNKSIYTSFGQKKSCFPTVPKFTLYSKLHPESKPVYVLKLSYSTCQSFLSRNSFKEIYKFGTVLIYHTCKKQNSLVYEPNKCLKCTLLKCSWTYKKNKKKKMNKIKCFSDLPTLIYFAFETGNRTILFGLSGKYHQDCHSSNLFRFAVISFYYFLSYWSSNNSKMM